LETETARLFKLSKISQYGLIFKINYDLKDSKSFVPSSKSKRRHVFIKKASVMEDGVPVVIRPRSAERLVFEYKWI
jgi:hypothetical protein